MEKIKFPKTYEDINITDLGVPGVEEGGVIFRFWDNPSKAAVEHILRVVSAESKDLLAMPEHKLKEWDEKYNQAIAALVIDCNLEGVSFETVEDVEAAYENPDLPIGLVHQVIVGYITKLLGENERVKKTVGLFLAQSPFGKEEKAKDSE